MSSSSSSKQNPGMAQNAAIGDKTRTSSIGSSKEQSRGPSTRSRTESQSNSSQQQQHQATGGGRNRKKNKTIDEMEAARGRLHHLFIEIEKEFEVILTENSARKYMIMMTMQLIKL